MKEINLKGVFKGIIFSCIVTFVAMLLITVLTYFTDIGMKAVDIIIFIGLGISVFSGSFFVSKSADKRCALHGLLVGVGVALIFAVCSFFVNGKILFNSHFVSMILLCLISSFTGGILGK